ncbi:hypothetical protein SADUNF_Sadunf15G0044900 [Salix dunnii]|uniref:cDENN domain-containing protein n=1 Tax=Salix dunnii TaxID=1413687 RepID=A0A835MNL9_9ROSI|nr:hypothetical protein SADUNF_Sadunf15G0044900 [Salix dunnii]
MDGNKGFHGMRVLYLPFLLDQYPLGNATNIIFGSITLCSVSALFPALLVLLYQNFCKPLWDVISYMVSNVPMPTPGKDLVLFAIENCLLSVEALLKDGLPHVEVPDYVLIALNSASTLLCYAYKNDTVNIPKVHCIHFRKNIEMDILERLMEHPSSKYGSTVSTNCDNLKSANYSALVTTQLILVALHVVVFFVHISFVSRLFIASCRLHLLAFIMFHVIVKVGLGLIDTDAWHMIETITEKNNIGYKQSWVQSMFSGGPSRAKAFGRARKGTSDGTSALNENGTPRQQDSSAAGQKKFQTNVRILRGHSGVIIALHCVTRREVRIGRSWVQSMFSGDPSRAKAFGRARKGTSDGTSALNENGTPRQQDSSAAGQKKFQTNVRILRGHSGVIIALHCVTRREVWDLVGDRKDAVSDVGRWFEFDFLGMLEESTSNYVIDNWRGLHLDITYIFFMFVVLRHVYIPLLFFRGAYRVDPLTPYMMGLHSSVDTPCSRWYKTALKLPWLLGLLGERGISYDENNYNRHDKLQDAIGRGQNTISILPSSLVEPKFLTISDPYIEILGSDTKITYDRFLSSIRSKEQEERRKQILATTSRAFVYRKYAPSSPSVQVGKDSLSPMERLVSFYIIIVSSEKASFLLSLISPIFLGLEWVLLLLFSLDGRKSLAYNGTCSKELCILIDVLFTGFAALIESNAERIGGNGFIDGWHCELTDEQFVAVKELAYNMARRGHLHQQELTLEDSKLNPLPFSLSSVEELFALCFSPAGSSKPLWDVISYMVSNVPMPTLGKDLVLFSIENCLLSVEAPPKDGLPHVEVSFQSMVQYLDMDNLLKLLTAVLFERRFYFVPTISDVGRWFEFDFLGMLEESTSNYVIDNWRGLHLDVFTFNPCIKCHMSFDLSL